MARVGFAYVRDPTTTDDVSQGWTESQLWYNATGATLWVCTDSTAAAAVWLRITGDWWEDIRVPLEASKSAATSPTWAVWRQDVGGTSTGVSGWHFASSGPIESLGLSIQTPHARKLSTDLDAHIHITFPNDTTGHAGETVVFAVEYTAAGIGEVFPVTTTLTSAAYTVLGTEQYKHILLDIGDIPAASLTTISSMATCRIYRATASDTYSDDVVALEFDAHYVLNAPGSDTETTK